MFKNKVIRCTTLTKPIVDPISFSGWSPRNLLQGWPRFGEKIVGQKIAQLKDMYQISSSPHQFFKGIHLEKKESILILLQVKRVKATEDTAAIEKWIRSCNIYHIFFTLLMTLFYIRDIVLHIEDIVLYQRHWRRPPFKASSYRALPEGNARHWRSHAGRFLSLANYTFCSLLFF